MILVVSSSLRAESNSRIMAREAHRILSADGTPASLLDLRDHPLPLCDAGDSFGHAHSILVKGLLEEATGVIVATPIYNYDANAAVKNLVEMTCGAWDNKVVGFLCAAGGMGSYMSIMPFANSLMLDFRSVIVPRFAYAVDGAFKDGAICDPAITQRIADVSRYTARLALALESTLT
jgi:NAD(P)H-dependent FMN reductase